MYSMPHALPGSGNAKMGHKMLFATGCLTFLECKYHFQQEFRMNSGFFIGLQAASRKDT